MCECMVNYNGGVPLEVCVCMYVCVCDGRDADA